MGTYKTAGLAALAIALVLVGVGVLASCVSTPAPPISTPQLAPTLTLEPSPTLATLTPEALAPAPSLTPELAPVTPTLTPELSPTAAIPTPESAPTLTPQPSLGPTLAPSGCTLHGIFIADVTVPDGTPMAPGQAFNKIWRMRNTGTCTWGAGYTFAFVRGELMGQIQQIAVPTTAPGATADLLVAMSAPTNPGTHRSFWRLKAPNGVFFGDELWVTINVPAPAPAPAPVVGCSGAPVIASFTASSTSINAGQSVTLNWGLVSNADNATINQGIGGVGTPGSTTVTPGSTTTYTLTASCGSTQTTAQVTVNVNASACSGTPIISSFTASPTTIQPGGSATLSYGLVGNADTATIDNGIGGVATPGSTTVSPSTTTTYTLTGLCGSTSTTARVTITVVSATAVPTLTPTTIPKTPTPPATPVPPTPTRTPTRTPTP